VGDKHDLCHSLTVDTLVCEQNFSAQFLLVPFCRHKKCEKKVTFSSCVGVGRAQARARTGLDFGLSPQSRPQACKPGHAHKSTSPEYKAQTCIKQARPDPNRVLRIECRTNVVGADAAIEINDGLKAAKKHQR
jgi:hypothetical protein